MKKLIAIVFSIALMASCLCHSAPRYFEFEPLAKRVDMTVKPVTGERQILPLITWGGDIATIHGNGNSDTTQKKSIFAEFGLNYRLEREDVFSRQVENYLSGKTPFLRGTLGMVQAAATVTEDNPNVKPIVFYQMTWSAGGDALVVKQGINSAKDLKGKTIAIQADGPHVDYAIQILKDANLTFNDVDIKWLADLTASPDSPPAALSEPDIDAAFMIIPDALALTSDGTVGTGEGDSIAGARILLSTKTASRVIADVYAVRADYYKKHKAKLRLLSQALLKAEKSMKHIVDNKIIYPQKYNELMSSSAKLLLDDAEAIADTEGLYADCQYVSLKGNRAFFNDKDYLRRFGELRDEISVSLTNLGLRSTAELIEHSDIDYSGFSLGMVRKKDGISFDRSKVMAALINDKRALSYSSDSELFKFEVLFDPNKATSFPVDTYRKQLDRAIELVSVYEGAMVIIEGYADPSVFLKKKKEYASSFDLGQIKQSARNISLLRAQSVRDTIFSLSKEKGISVNPNQFITVGHGISKPKTGICGDAPCAPKNESEWLSNMYVSFRIIPLEAQSEAL